METTHDQIQKCNTAVLYQLVRNLNRTPHPRLAIKPFNAYIQYQNKSVKKLIALVTGHGIETFKIFSFKSTSMCATRVIAYTNILYRIEQLKLQKS